MKEADRVVLRKTPPMNWALWKRAVGDGQRQLMVSCLLLFFFGWMFVWWMSMISGAKWGKLLHLMPKVIKDAIGEDIVQLATPIGQLSVLYVHLIVILLCLGWAVGRGSNMVSGEIARGTMEHLLALPVRRITVLLIPVCVATVGAAMLALSVWAGVAVGVSTVREFAELSAWSFLPGTVNLFFMIFCLIGVATLFSACDHDRWRVIWRTCGFYVVSLIFEMVGRIWEAGWWLQCCSFLAAYDPQKLILNPGQTWSLPLWGDASITLALAWWYNLILAILGLAAFAAAAIVFLRRDIPVSR